MSNIDKMRVGSTTYDIADSTSRSNIGDLTQLNTSDKSSLVNAINEAMTTGGSSGLTNDIKEALLALLEKVAYIDEDGQDYYDALHDALYPPANLVSISAVYTQSGTVYDTDSLDNLKSDLVVTAHYDDSSTQIVTTYTLSGTLTTGTSTITVTYGGKTTTFTVTVTHATTQYTITNTLTNCTNSNNASVINELTSYSGTLTATSGYVLSTVTVSMGGTDVTSTAYSSADGSISISSVTGNIVITAEAIEDVGWISGVPYDMTDGLIENKYLNNGVETAYNGWAISPYLPCTGAFIISDTAFAIAYCGGYNANEEYVNRVAIPANRYFNFDELEYASFRVSEAKTKVTGSTITPYKLAELTETTVYDTSQYYVPDEWTEGAYINVANGNIVTNDSYRYSNFMNCYNATTITDNVDAQGRGYCFYDGDKNFISGAEIAASDGTADKQTPVPSGARYFRCWKRSQAMGLCFKLS